VALDPREARDLIALKNRLLTDGDALAKGFRDVAEINDAFVSGNQYGGVTYRNNQTVITRDEWADNENVPRIHVNVLGNLVDTLVSLITKNRPCAVARALSEDNPEDIYDAEVANLLIRFLSQELKTVEHIQRATKLAEKHGSGGIKAWFDPKTKKACIAPTSVFNVTIDPYVEDVKDGRWFIFHQHPTLEEATKLIAGVDVKRKPKEETYTTSSGIKKKGVKAQEVWVRPGYFDEYPRGKYAFIVDDVVVEITDYPLIIEDDSGLQSLPPLVWITAKAVEECVYGRTSVTDCLPLQRMVNEATSRTLKYLRIGSSPKLVHPDQLPEGVDPYADAKIPFPTTEEGIAAANAMKWLQGPPIPQEAFDLRDFAIKQMHDVLGVAPLTAGTDTRNVSGKALEEIEGLDQQKNSQTTRSIETAVLDLYRLLLMIVQRFYDDGRKMQIVGVDGAQMLLFNRADIMGKDLRLEPASEFDLMQPTEEQAAIERQQQGLESAADVRATARDPRTSYSKGLAERLVGDMLAGKDINVSPDDIDMDAFKAVVAKHKRLAMLDGRRSDYLSLVQFDKFVDELAAQQAESVPQAPTGDPTQTQPTSPQQAPPPPTGQMQ
jgi:hypothetical protein